MCALVVPLFAAAAPVGRAEGANDPASVLEQLREKRKQEDARQERDFQALIEQGRAFLGQQAHEDAKRVLTQAARLRPGDEACARLLAQAGAASPAAAPDKLLTDIREQHQSKDTMLQVQLGASLFEAEKALKAGDHARALEHAERVLEGVAYVTEADRAARLRAQADTIAASARKAAERTQASDLQNAVAAHKERATEDKAATLATLKRQGWVLRDTGEPDKALNVADEMLRLDPGNRQALYLRQEARRIAGAKDDVATIKKERKDLENKLLINQLEEEMTVPKDAKAKIVLPGNKKAGDLVKLSVNSMEPWERELRAKLNEAVEVDFKETTLADACRALARAADCTVMVDPSVANDSRRFTLPKMKVSLEHALRWVCRFGKCSFSLRDHAILVTTPGGVLDEPVTKYYDIASLLAPGRNVKTTFNGGTQADNHTAGIRDLVASTQSAGSDPERDPVAEDAMGQGWARFIRSTVAPETWEEPGKDDVRQQASGYTINYRNGRIVIVHTPEVQEQVERLLNDFRRARTLQVHILARFLVVQTDFLEQYNLDLVGPNFDLAADELTLGTGTSPAANYGYVSEPTDLWQTGGTPPEKSRIGYLFNDSRVSVGGEGELNGTGPLEIRWAHAGRRTVNALLQAVAKRRKGTILAAPRLTCFNTQRANFQAITNYNYVRSINSDGEPQIGNVPDGIVFDVQPFVSTDRRYITLVLQPQMRTLRNREFQNQAFEYATGVTVPIIRRVNLPDTELRSLATTVTIPDGATMLVGGLSVVRERSGEGSVPFLHDIPLLKYIFREWTSFDTRNSLVVLVTAEIVPDIFEE